MSDLLHEQKILILDFGSQYTQNIARKVRECQVYCEIHPCTMPLDKIAEFNAKGIILSGGPASVLDLDSPLCNPKLFFHRIIAADFFCFFRETGASDTKWQPREETKQPLRQVPQQLAREGLTTPRPNT